MSPTSQKNSTQMENMKYCSLTVCIATDSELRFSHILFWAVGQFTVMCLVTWPMNATESGGDLALIQSSLLSSVKCQLVNTSKVTRP